MIRLWTIGRTMPSRSARPAASAARSSSSSSLPTARTLAACSGRQVGPASSTPRTVRGSARFRPSTTGSTRSRSLPMARRSPRGAGTARFASGTSPMESPRTFIAAPGFKPGAAQAAGERCQCRHQRVDARSRRAALEIGPAGTWLGLPATDSHGSIFRLWYMVATARRASRAGRRGGGVSIADADDLAAADAAAGQAGHSRPPASDRGRRRRSAECGRTRRSPPPASCRAGPDWRGRRAAPRPR